MIRAAIDSRLTYLPSDHWHVASARTLLGASLIEQNKLNEARSILQESHAQLVRVRGENDRKAQEAAELLDRVNARLTAQ